MIKVILIFILSISSAFAGNKNYGDIEIPVISGAKNVAHKQDNRFHVISTSYDLVLINTQHIYDFYNEYFTKIGWENPLGWSDPLNGHKGKWSSYGSSFNQKGLPVSSYTSSWKAKDIPAMGVVNVSLTSFKNEKFNATVTVSVSPEIDTSSLSQLLKLMTGDPKNIFILYEAIGGNPFELEKVNLQPLTKHKDNEIVKKYYELIDTILEQYTEFGSKYVN